MLRFIQVWIGIPLLVASAICLCAGPLVAIWETIKKKTRKIRFPGGEVKFKTKPVIFKEFPIDPEEIIMTTHEELPEWMKRFDPAPVNLGTFPEVVVKKGTATGMTEWLFEQEGGNCEACSKAVFQGSYADLLDIYICSDHLHAFAVKRNSYKPAGVCGFKRRLK